MCVPIIKCGCEYRVHLDKYSREPNAPWRITVCKLEHTYGCKPTLSSVIVCTQRGKKQYEPVFDAMLGHIGEVPTSSVTRADLKQVRTGFDGNLST
jgi:hypothetical protein